MISTALLILLAFALICTLIGFAIGRISVTVPRIPANVHLLGVLSYLSDANLARIAHEARRAVEQAQGVFSTKSWNNLTDAHRDSLTRSAAYQRANVRQASGSIFSAIVAGLGAKA